eukprot:GFYU01016563.1.p1 GENE.GFYU01016563.1~~GFYU01016563.1.p1  ORF type:complete len:335 (-),score=56.69 GFYU01016563.1:26-1030(-)
MWSTDAKSVSLAVGAAATCGLVLGYLAGTRCAGTRAPACTTIHTTNGTAGDDAEGGPGAGDTQNDATTHCPDTSHAQHAGQPRDSTARVCIVTGGSRGIGAAICERLARDGYKVAVNYARNSEEAEAVVQRIHDAGGDAIAVQADVSVVTEVTRLFDTVEGRLGRVTACVNNAAILGPLTGLFEDSTWSQLEQVMRINLYGAFHVLREAARRMSRDLGGHGGAIVNISAGSAYTGTPLAYAMSKGALNSLTEGCVGELAACGIRVNSVSPGPCYTDMMADFSKEDIAWMANTIPMKRPGQPAEIAEGVAWLLSDHASFVSGSNLRIAGGKPLMG